MLSACGFVPSKYSRHIALALELVTAIYTNAAPPLALAESDCLLIKKKKQQNLWQPYLIAPISFCCSLERRCIIVGIFGTEFSHHHKGPIWCGNILYLTKPEWTAGNQNPKHDCNTTFYTYMSLRYLSYNCVPSFVNMIWIKLYSCIHLKYIRDIVDLLAL